MGTMNIHRREPAMEEFMAHLMYETRSNPALNGPMEEMKKRNYDYERAYCEWEGRTFNPSEIAPWVNDDPWVFVAYNPLTGKSCSNVWIHGLADPHIHMIDMVAFCTEKS